MAEDRLILKFSCNILRTVLEMPKEDKKGIDNY